MVALKQTTLLFLSLFLFGTALALPAADAADADAASSNTLQQINKYRAEMKPNARPALSYEPKLRANAMKTVVDDDGTEKHELNPGTKAQVLAPTIPVNTCDEATFVKALVQGWICERPSLLPKGTCEANSGYAHTGETGHADILSSTEYTKVGCACYKGIWGCDFA